MKDVKEKSWKISTTAIFVKKMFLKPSSFHYIKLFDSILKNSVQVKMTENRS